LLRREGDCCRKDFFISPLLGGGWAGIVNGATNLIFDCCKTFSVHPLLTGSGLDTTQLQQVVTTFED
jgi:hypothetical protein